MSSSPLLACLLDPTGGDAAVMGHSVNRGPRADSYLTVTTTLRLEGTVSASATLRTTMEALDVYLPLVLRND